MSEETKDTETKSGSSDEHEAPKGAEHAGRWTGGDQEIAYTARAGWTILRKQEKPAAEMFSVSYVADVGAGDDAERPVTFVFNGGPGASSAYLHMGVVGPSRVAFPADGSAPPMPPRLVDNEESWLAFTDLVFVDPIGTGFSRVIEKDDKGAGGDGKDGKGSGDATDPKEYFGYKRDLESLCEFISRWLSTNGRWGAPVFIAGESYGGYRVGRLVRMLQESTGVGLSGAILISPALELGGLVPTDYSIAAWVDLIPTMALAAAYHGRSRAFPAGGSDGGGAATVEEIAAAAEAFAVSDLPTLLAGGASLDAGERHRILSRLADLIGLPLALVERAEARVGIEVFVRELLRDEQRVVGLYDATITAVDPFPDRDPYAGADPTLSGLETAFTTAINRQLRSEIGVQTDREYRLLSLEVNMAWRNDAIEHFFAPPVGATDDFRYGLALNPHMRAFICHGRYDLVTPYFTTDRLRNLMRLDPSVAGRVTVQHFGGGHMFYAWEESRRAFSAAIAQFVAEATA